MINANTDPNTNVPVAGEPAVPILDPAPPALPEPPAGQATIAPDRIAEIEKSLADYKKQIADRDRKVNELFGTIESLKKDKMTDEERLAHDKQRFEEQQSAFELQKVEFEKQKMLNYVSDKMSSKGYFNGLSVEEIANLKQMVLAGTIEEADSRIAALDNTLGKLTQNKFGGAGKPLPSKEPEGSVWNPFAPDQLNVTEQHKLWKENPDKAKQLEKAAKGRK